MLILGIETSCDETAVAIVQDGRTVIISEVFSQIGKHQQWGGVIPEYASRMHLETLHGLIKQALSNSGLSFKDINAIAVTQGPGLLGSLLIGVNTAKILAWIHQKPIIPVNHLHGHICANFIDSDLEPPFICMLVSGGHTQIIHVKSFTEIEILGETVDDAAGEAFDKVARLMDLPYPGGPELDKLAKSHQGDLKASHVVDSTAIVNGYYRFPIPKVANFDFSFSGIKTSVLRLKQKLGDEYWEIDKSKIASAFQRCVAETLYQRTLLVLQSTGLSQLVIAGGVAANSEIRKIFQERFSNANGYNLVIPSLEYCTDNAAMIASAGYFNYVANLDLASQNLTYIDFEVFSRG